VLPESRCWSTARTGVTGGTWITSSVSTATPPVEPLLVSGMGSMPLS